MSNSVGRKFTFWVVYDAMSDRKYIKTDRRTGCLAFFDTERHAAFFAADCPGADYEELVLYSYPQPAPDTALVEAFDAGRRAAQSEADGLAAPAAQGEPVGWYTEDHLDDKSATTYNAEVAQRWRAKGWPVTPLYTTPQPSFQLPDFATDPDDSDEGASLWDHGYKTGWNSCLEDVVKAMQSAEQQPAPDVSGLVEALEPFAKCADELDGAPEDGIDPADDDEWAKFRLLVSDFRRARAALAAHRKGGGV